MFGMKTETLVAMGAIAFVVAYAMKSKNAAAAAAPAPQRPGDFIDYLKHMTPGEMIDLIKNADGEQGLPALTSGSSQINGMG